MLANPFELLKGAGEQLPKQKKKKNKPKPAAAIVKHDDSTDKPKAETLPFNQPNGTASVGSRLAPTGPNLAQLEEAARTNVSGAQRLQLWDSWMRQASDGSIKAAHNHNTDTSFGFKQSLLQSRALELTVEACLADGPLPQPHQHALQQLLATFLPHTDAGAVTQAVSQLAALLADGAAAFGSALAAQRAVHDVVAALKEAELAAAASEDANSTGKQAALQDKLDRVSRELAKQEKVLQAMAPEPGTVSKQHLTAAQQLVKLQSDRLQLLQQLAGGSGSRTAAAQERALRSLSELKAAINAAWQDSMASEHSRGNAPSKQAAAAVDKEVAQLQQAEARLMAEMQALEQQLSLLKLEAARVSERRRQLAQRQNQNGKGGAAANGNSSALAPKRDAAVYQAQLTSLDRLGTVLLASGEASAQGPGNAANIEAAVQYLGTLRQLLGMQLGLLVEMPNRVKFAKQRLEQAKKLHAVSSARSGPGSGPPGASKQVADASALLADTIAAADDAMLRTDQAVAMARQHLAQLGLVGQLQPALQELEAMQGSIRAAHTAAADQARS